MHATSSPFPGMLECYRLSVTLNVIVLFLAKKYQQTLDISTIGIQTEVYNKCHSPLPAEYTPMYMVWVTLVESGISQR